MCIADKDVRAPLKGEVAMKRATILCIILLVALIAAGCGTDGLSPHNDNIPTVPAAQLLKAVPDFPSNPKDFVNRIDNPYLAFERGKVFRYEGATEDGLETLVIEVTHATKRESSAWLRRSCTIGPI
jgi:hypothetical protein